MQTTHGFLKENSPLMKVFPSGYVPLISPLDEIAALGAANKPEKVFLSDPRKWEPEERAAAARFMVELGQGTLEQAQRHIDTTDKFPIRAMHFGSVSADLRLFL